MGSDKWGRKSEEGWGPHCWGNGLVQEINTFKRLLTRLCNAAGQNQSQSFYSSSDPALFTFGTSIIPDRKRSSSCSWLRSEQAFAFMDFIDRKTNCIMSPLIPAVYHCWDAVPNIRAALIALTLKKHWRIWMLFSLFTFFKHKMHSSGCELLVLISYLRPHSVNFKCVINISTTWDSASITSCSSPTYEQIFEVVFAFDLHHN